jgi:hypothetical protein
MVYRSANTQRIAEGARERFIRTGYNQASARDRCRFGRDIAKRVATTFGVSNPDLRVELVTLTVMERA